ncbi:hypothetical protein E2C01_039949 [Portunus trituberculatus]|uniref:Uncharacterized protein n=1 Tax=Portunus trituberculatus TaxID=210409 RepID=A0A5B7FLD8_PORTR|nr:hypothetical protein [Portunus trituberculatus]
MKQGHKFLGLTSPHGNGHISVPSAGLSLASQLTHINKVLVITRVGTLYTNSTRHFLLALHASLMLSLREVTKCEGNEDEKN